MSCNTVQPFCKLFINIPTDADLNIFSVFFQCDTESDTGDKVCCPSCYLININCSLFILGNECVKHSLDCLAEVFKELQCS